jgi:hypothetical protein
MLDCIEDFMSYVDKTDDCWQWKGYKTSRGHGVYFIKNPKTVVPAHRFMYEYCYGSIPDGLVVRHLCRNKCVNPDHITIGTAKENAEDRKRDGTEARGEHHGRSKLSEEEVITIRSSTDTQEVLAKRYGVAQSLISGIKKGKYWSWL